MELQPPPITPEEMSQLSGSEFAQLGQPQQVKIFGIIHVVLGGYGVLTVLWALVAVFAANLFIKFMGNTPEMQMQIAIQTKLLPVTIAGNVISAIITALLLTAGILLLKGRKSGLKWSNRYAYTSLAGKIINVILALMFTIPLTQDMMQKTPGPATSVLGNMEVWMTFSIIGVSLLSCIYPVLVLILLNRPNIKTWFANQPS